MAENITPNGVQVGDRIRLIAPMTGDPCPIEVGDEGLVTWINHLQPGLVGVNGSWQIGVEWVSGRSLMLAVPPDKFDIVVADTCKWCRQDIWPTGRDEDGAEWRNAEGEVVCDGAGSVMADHEPMTIDDEVKQTLDLMALSGDLEVVVYPAWTVASTTSGEVLS